MRKVTAALALALALGPAVPPAYAQAPPVLSTRPTPPAGAVPDASQMSGFPLQVGDLPPGILAVRVIRRTFTAVIPNQTVELYVGAAARAMEGTTGADGRAEFSSIGINQQVHVRTIVDGELLESQRFQMPTQGGVRLVLVAGVGAGVPEASRSAAATPGPSFPVSSSTDAARLYVAAPLVLMLAGASVLWLRTRPAPARPGPAVAAVPLSPRAELAARRERTFERLVWVASQCHADLAREDAYRSERERLMAELISLDQELERSLVV